MDGFRSGRHGGKRTTGDMWALDIRSIAKAGRLVSGQSFIWQWLRNGEPAAKINITIETGRVMLDYRARDRDSEWQAMKYPVHLSWTTCTYGGQRAWWLCPVVGCGRRVAILYGGKIYACRHCHQLAYQTQREQSHDRASSRADKLRGRLGWKPGILNSNGCKPKGMHWRIFEILKAQHDSLVTKALAGMINKLPGIRDFTSFS